MPTAPTKAIVLLDDEKSYADLMCGLLTEGFDCPVHAFYRPLDALSALPAIKPGVVVTDYFMPQIDGLEFVRRASELSPGTAFVLITGHNLSLQKDQINRLRPIKGVLAKPFGWSTLAAEILRVWPADVPVPMNRGDIPAI